MDGPFSDENGAEVDAEVNWMNLQASDPYEEAYPVRPLMEGPQAQMGGVAMGLAMPPPHPAALQPPAIQRPAVQQSIFQQAVVPVPQPIPQQPPAIQQQAFQQPIFHPPSAYQPAIQPSLASQHAAQQPIAHQPAIQMPHAHQPITNQPALQQSGPSNRACPVQSCDYVPANDRLDHLWDHLAESHGYERAANEYSILDHQLKRRNVPVLERLFIRDIRKLRWNQARLQAVEEAIAQRDQSYASVHGLRFAFPHPIPEVIAGKKQTLIVMLKRVRNELLRQGRLYNQLGQAQSTFDQVYQNLVTTFQLDQNTQDAVIRQAEQYFATLRSVMGDNMNENITPARVMLTDELVLKPGASLPQK